MQFQDLNKLRFRFQKNVQYYKNVTQSQNNIKQVWRTYVLSAYLGTEFYIALYMRFLSVGMFSPIFNKFSCLLTHFNSNVTHSSFGTPPGCYTLQPEI